MNGNTKYWCFTWNTNISQKKLPNESFLMNYLNEISETGVFQLERGEIKAKPHYQGTFSLIGERQSEKRLLSSFQQRFKNVGGLTLSPAYDKVAAAAYASKECGRIRGPFYVGAQELYSTEVAQLGLRG